MELSPDEVSPMTAAAVGRGSGFARSWLAIVAAIGVASDLGCSQFKSRKGASERSVATLGEPSIGRDIYAKRGSAEAPASVTIADPPLASSPAPEPSLAGEIVPVAESSELPPAATEAGVTLRPPIGVDPARSGSLSTTIGVPDGVRLIAGSELRPRVSSTNAPPVGKPTTKVIAAARQALDGMNTYQLSLRRQERVGGVLLPAEDLVMSIRRAPKAARLTWVDGAHRGREVLYRSDDGAGLMHVNMADSKIPLPRMALPPDSPMVLKNSRHPITEAGLDPLVAGMERAEAAGELTDLGMQTPPPLTTAQQGVLRRTPEGEVWRAFFDPANHLPSLVDCRAANGDLLESYLFSSIQPDPIELATLAAFDPAARWGPPKGLFGRTTPRTARADPAATTR